MKRAFVVIFHVRMRVRVLASVCARRVCEHQKPLVIPEHNGRHFRHVYMKAGEALNSCISQKSLN